MTYYKPDPVNIFIITWASRAIVASLALALVAVMVTIALRALVLMCGSVIELAHTIPAFLSSLDPLVQLVCIIFAMIAILMICKKFVTGILASVQGGRLV